MYSLHFPVLKQGDFNIVGKCYMSVLAQCFRLPKWQPTRRKQLLLDIINLTNY